MPAVPPDEATSRRIWHDEVRTLAAQHLEMDLEWIPARPLSSLRLVRTYTVVPREDEKQTEDDATWASKTCSNVQLRPASQPAMVSQPVIHWSRLEIYKHTCILRPSFMRSAVVLKHHSAKTRTNSLMLDTYNNPLYLWYLCPSSFLVFGVTHQWPSLCFP